MTTSNRAVLFDLDGTLTDTVRIIAGAMADAATEAGYPVTTERAAEFVGIPIDTGMAELTGLAVADERVIEIIADYRARYFPAVEAAGIEVLLPGAIDLLRELRGAGFLTGIVTAKSPKSALHLLDLVGLTPLVDCLVPSGVVARGKPSPDPVEYAMNQLAVQPALTWYLGDAVTDVQMAKAAGMPALGVTTGAGTRQQLLAAGAAAVVDSLTEALPIVSATPGA